jgi:hypothetical protein
VHSTIQVFRAFPFLLVHSPMHAGACIHLKFISYQTDFAEAGMNAHSFGKACFESH